MIYNIIEELRNTTSTNEKKEILEKYKVNPLFKDVLKFAYDSSYVFGIKKIPEPIYDENYGKMSYDYELLSKALLLIESVLVIGKLRGNKAIDFLAKLLGKLKKEDQEIIINILKKDLRCGINKKLIQKIFPDLIFDIGYMGAVPYDKKKVEKIFKENYFIFLQEKMDGEYSNLILDIPMNKVEFFSRNNKIQNIPKKIKDKILKEAKEAIDNGYDIFPEKIILNGELLIEGFNRYTSNGLLSRIFKYEEYLQTDDKKADKALKVIEEISGLSYNELIDKISYYIWDYQAEDDTPYFSRFGTLAIGNDNSIIDNISIFKLVPTIIVLNEEIIKDIKLNIAKEAFEYYQNKFKNFLVRAKNIEEFFKIVKKYFSQMLSEDKEGIIIKSGIHPWKSGKPVYQVKLKLDFECELRIIGFKPGEPGKKFENTLGSFIVESEDGILKTDPGGIPEDIRDEVWNNKEEYLNKIITVKSCGISKDKDGNISLLHPSFVKFREDKDKADTYEEIEKIQESILKGD